MTFILREHLHNFDLMAQSVYNVLMLKRFTISALVITTSALAVPAYACGFHGGGFGGFGNANWEPFNPRISTEDPALLNKNTQDVSLIIKAAEKTRPSFSNVANRASFIAKARVAKKIKDRDDKASKIETVKKTVLNADR